MYSGRTFFSLGLGLSILFHSGLWIVIALIPTFVMFAHGHHWTVWRFLWVSFVLVVGVAFAAASISDLIAMIGIE